jgi:hypothetical protein
MTCFVYQPNLWEFESLKGNSEENRNISKKITSERILVFEAGRLRDFDSGDERRWFDAETLLIPEDNFNNLVYNHTFHF